MQRGLMQWPAVRFEDRVRSAEIEYSQSRYLGDGELEGTRQRPSTLGPEISTRLTRKLDFGACSLEERYRILGQPLVVRSGPLLYVADC